MERHVTFEKWFSEWYTVTGKKSMDEFSLDDLEAAFNAGRTEARPRVWRYVRRGGSWQVEFLELNSETSNSSKQSVSNEERLSDSPEVSSTEATDSQI